jgi:hypothetical protein
LAVLGSLVALSFSNVVYFVCKGIIWLLFATGAGLIIVASIASSPARLRSHSLLQIFVSLDLTRIFFFPTYPE